MLDFSVIIPCRNSEKFISYALDSLLAQNWDKLEIILIDDNSTDGTVTLLESYRGKFDRYPYKILTADVNHLPGPAAVRNVGLREAKGKYIAFLDADDVWTDGHLKRAFNALEKHDEAVSFYGLSGAYNEQREPIERIYGEGPEPMHGSPFDAANLFLKQCASPLPSVCARRSVIEEIGFFNERLITAQDWWMWISLAKKGPFVFSGEIEMHCRISELSHTGGGTGVNPMLTGPGFIYVASKSTYLTADEYNRIRKFWLNSCSKRLQYFIRTVDINVLSLTLKRFFAANLTEKAIWIWIYVVAIFRVISSALGRVKEYFFKNN